MNARVLPTLTMILALAAAAAPLAGQTSPSQPAPWASSQWTDGAWKISKGPFSVNRYGANANIRAGLSSAVGVATWPQVGLYVREWDNWLVPNAGFVVPGKSPSDKAEKITRVEQSWTCEKYAFVIGGKTLDCWISRLTPMLLFRTDADRLTLFRNAKIMGGKPTPITPPAWAVGMVGGKPKTIAKGESLDGLSEGWVIVGFGREAGWKERMTSSSGATHGEYSLDWPWLVVLSGKPSRVGLGENGLEVDSADPAGVGFVGAMPLSGVRTIELDESDALRKAPSEKVIQSARAFQSQMCRYPIGAVDQFMIEGRSLAVRNKFTYVDVPSAWLSASAKPFAPIPPLVQLAASYGMKIAIQGEVRDLEYPTVVGPYAVVAGGDELVYRVPDLLKYVWEAPRYDLAQSDPQVLTNLTREIDRMVAGGHLAPVIWHTGAESPVWDFYDRGELFAVLADCLSVLPEASQPALKAYLGKEFQAYNPLTGKGLARGEGARREPYTPLPEQLKGDIGGGLAYTNAYDIWRYADRTGQWDFIAKNWRPLLASFQGQDLARVDWAFLGSGGSTEELTQTLTAYIGLARIADRVGQPAMKQLAQYMAGQQLIARLAYSKQAFYCQDTQQDHGWVRENAPDAPVRVTGHGSYAYPGPSEDYLYLGKLMAQGVVTLPKEQADELARLLKTVDRPALADTRQVATGDEMWVRLSTVRDPRTYMKFDLLGVAGASPEVFRFAADQFPNDLRRYLNLVEIKMPGWYMTDPWTRGVWLVHNFADWGIDPPRFGYWMFLAKAQFADASASQLKSWLDIPYCTGDLMYLEKALATLRAGGKTTWQDIEKK